MSKIALHGFDIVPGADSGHGVTVPEIVEPCVRPSDGRSGLFKGSVQCRLCQVVPKCVRKYKVATMPYAYLIGMLKVMDELNNDLGSPGFKDTWEELNKKRLDCADKLYFVKESLEYFLPKVWEAWEKESDAEIAAINGRAE